jgi:hypothetical protein
MATLTYKGFVLTDATITDDTSEEWGPRENQLDEDIIDTIVGDCISALKTTLGHKHNKLYNSAGTKVFESDASSTRLGSGSDTVIINVNESSDFGMAIIAPSSSDIFFSVDPVNEIVRVGNNSYPTCFSSDGGVYTRNVFDVDHIIYGLTDITTDVVEMITIGAQSYLHISIAGTKSGSDLFVSVPFTSALSIAEGETIGTTLGINNTTEVVVGIKRYENSLIGTDIRLIPIGGTPEASTWSGSNPCSVSLTIPFTLNDPEFVNDATP